MTRRFLFLLFQHSRIRFPLSALFIEQSMKVPMQSTPMSMKRLRSDSFQQSHDADCETVSSLLATMTSVDICLRTQTARSFNAFLLEWESKSSLRNETQSSTLLTEAGLVSCLVRSVDVTRRVAAEDKKLTTRKKLQNAALYIQRSSAGEESSILGSFFSIALVLAILALTTTPDTRTTSRSAASAFASTLQDSLKSQEKDVLNHGVFEELVHALIRFAASSISEGPSIPDAGKPAQEVDLHILTMLARSLCVKTCGTQEIAEAVAKVVRQALQLDDSGGPDEGQRKLSKSLDIDLVFDSERSSKVASGLSLAAQIGPWKALDPVELVQIAVLYNQWHGAERICHSVTSHFDDRCDCIAVTAVHALIDASLSSRLYRQADTFSTQFFDAGGQSRFLEARFLHACDTISKVIQKRALPVIERQVERIDQTVKKLTDCPNQFDAIRSPSSDDGTTTIATASMDIREFAIRQLEESLDVDAAHRLASIWNMSYTYNEKDFESALAARRQKFIQWDDLLAGKTVPELLTTPALLEAAFVELGVHPVYGFDVEWGDDGSGAALLQIASAESVVLVDIPALSKSVEGADALERTVGKLFTSPNVTVVGFGCRQDLLKLRSSPCARERHWFSEATAVRDLQALMDGPDGRVGMGLSRCCEQYLSKPLDKSEQCSDWLRRPLNEKQRVHSERDIYYTVVKEVLNCCRTGTHSQLFQFRSLKKSRTTKRFMTSANIAQLSSEERASKLVSKRILVRMDEKGKEPIPWWFDQGHINDSRARRLELSTPNTVFMQTLKKPRVGMRTETSIQSKQGKWIQMTGIITWVGEATSCETIKESDSLLWSEMSRGTNTKAKDLDENRKYEFLLNTLGSLHGQRIKSLSRVSDVVDTDLPVANEFVAEITYRFDDTMYFPWVVEGIRHVQGSELDQFSFFIFEFFEGCSCYRWLKYQYR